MTVNPEKEELKALITEARQCLKDLRLEKKKIDEYIKGKIYNLIDDQIGGIIQEALVDITKEIQRSEEAIHKRFANIEEEILGGKKKPAVEQLIERNKLIREALSKARVQRDINT